MKKRHFLLIAALCLPGSLISGQQPKAPVSLSVEAGQTFRLAVDSNPSTGYEWQLSKPVNPKVARLLGVQFLKPESTKPGAPGQDIWEFRAVGQGKAEIHLKYVRPWKAAQPARTTNFLVSVTAPKAGNPAPAQTNPTPTAPRAAATASSKPAPAPSAEKTAPRT